MDPVEAQFAEILQAYGPAIRRLCRSSERDPARCGDLEQDVLLALWRSLPSFRSEASVRTWAMRVAHNVATTHVIRASRDRLSRAVSLEDLEVSAPPPEVDRLALYNRVQALLEQLKPLDRTVVLLYLEDMPQKEIAEVTGISPTHVSTKLHRIKRLLSRAFVEENTDV